jgi:hypothetical protein
MTRKLREVRRENLINSHVDIDRISASLQKCRRTEHADAIAIAAIHQRAGRHVRRAYNRFWKIAPDMFMSPIFRTFSLNPAAESTSSTPDEELVLQTGEASPARTGRQPIVVRLVPEMRLEKGEPAMFADRISFNPGAPGKAPALIHFTSNPQRYQPSSRDRQGVVLLSAS